MRERAVLLVILRAAEALEVIDDKELRQMVARMVADLVALQLERLSEEEGE